MTFLVWLQKPCGPRANPVNHVRKVVVNAPDWHVARKVIEESVCCEDMKVLQVYTVEERHLAVVSA